MSRSELFKRHSGNPIILPDAFPYRVNAVFNAGCAKYKNETILLCRVEDFNGLSHFTVARSPDGIGGWEINQEPAMAAAPERFPEERWGIEDPRITYLYEIGKWAITYTAFSDLGPLVSLALTDDFITFERLGCVLPPENKDAALFPVKINGKWALLHRPAPRKQGCRPHIWVSFSPDLVHWGSHSLFLKARTGPYWDSAKVGLSAPPLLVDKGWLMLYHGVKEYSKGSIYRLGLALLDKEDPAQVISRPTEWVFGPAKDYERVGDVGNVTFSCGWLLDENMIRVYYGAADSTLCCATAKLADILDFLER